MYCLSLWIWLNNCWKKQQMALTFSVDWPLGGPFGALLLMPNSPGLPASYDPHMTPHDPQCSVEFIKASSPP